MKSIKILWGIYNIPALIFHEVCHIVLILIFWFGFLNFSFKAWKITISKNLIEMNICYECYNKYVISLISIAPLFGWMITYILLGYYKHWLIVYFVPGIYMAFMPSKQDLLLIKKQFPTNKIIQSLL